MISTILENLWAFAISMPTNMVILIIICVIMKLCKAKIRDCVAVILGYLFIGLLLAMFGITMPSFLVIGRWLADLVKSIFEDIW